MKIWLVEIGCPDWRATIITEKYKLSTGNPTSNSRRLIYLQQHELRGWNFFFEFSVMYMTV